MEKLINERILLGSVLSNPKLWIEYNSEVLTFIVDNFYKELVTFKPIRSYSSIVFLLSIKKSDKKFILKFRATDELMKIQKEVSVYKVLSNKVITPNILLYAISNNYEVVIYEYLDSRRDISRVFKEADILKIWTLTLVIQKSLFDSSNLLCINTNIAQNYSYELGRYTLKYVNRVLNPDYLVQFDNRFNSVPFVNYMTIFSDRSSMNWIVGDKDVIPVDFDLMFAGSCLADFVQFIDCHNLFAVYGRSTLINKCLEFLDKNNIQFSEQDFHWYAAYRNLVQGAIFYGINKRVSFFHYKRALISLKIVNEKLITKEIKKILKEVAWI